MAYKSEKDLAYYLTLFKIEGHETWRAHISGHKDGFSEYIKNPGHPIVTDQKTSRVDRITGEIKEI